jgi:hypothetical protein
MRTSTASRVTCWRGHVSESKPPNAPPGFYRVSREEGEKAAAPTSRLGWRLLGTTVDERDTDNRDPTTATVNQLVPALLNRGLQPVTVSRLLRLDLRQLEA